MCFRDPGGGGEFSSLTLDHQRDLHAGDRCVRALCPVRLTQTAEACRTFCLQEGGGFRTICTTVKNLCVDNGPGSGGLCGKHTRATCDAPRYTQSQLKKSKLGCPSTDIPAYELQLPCPENAISRNNLLGHQNQTYS